MSAQPMDARFYALAGNYLAEPHLQGKRAEVEIERVEVHEFEKRKKGEEIGKGRKVKKPVLFFKGKALPFGLTARCNIESMIDMHGREMSAWVGKRVALNPTTCLAFGKTTPCIRIERP